MRQETGLGPSLCWVWGLNSVFVSEPDQSSPVSELQDFRVRQAAPFKPGPLMLKGECLCEAPTPTPAGTGQNLSLWTSGLADTEWAGRTQTLRHGAVTYFLDGAHTMRSMQACVHWFRQAAAQQERSCR